MTGNTPISDETDDRTLGEFIDDWTLTHVGRSLGYAASSSLADEVTARLAPLLVSAEAETQPCGSCELPTTNVDTFCDACCLDELEQERDRLHSWAGLMELLDEHWPADIFPTRDDNPKGDDGPRIISLLRWVEGLRAELAERDAELAHLIAQLRHAVQVDEWRVPPKDTAEIVSVAIETLAKHWDCGDDL